MDLSARQEARLQGRTTVRSRVRPATAVPKRSATPSVMLVCLTPSPNLHEIDCSCWDQHWLVRSWGLRMLALLARGCAQAAMHVSRAKPVWPRQRSTSPLRKTTVSVSPSQNASRDVPCAALPGFHNGDGGGGDDAGGVSSDPCCPVESEVAHACASLALLASLLVVLGQPEASPGSLFQPNCTCCWHWRMTAPVAVAHTSANQLRLSGCACGRLTQRRHWYTTVNACGTCR